MLLSQSKLQPANQALDGEIAIRCQGLSKQYGSVQALSGLDLAIPAGSIFGFLGRNGAGKTTAIRLLTGLAAPTGGTAWVGGVETTSGDSLAREKFGYLPQEPAFYNWMTPREYLDYAGRLFELPASLREQRIAEMLALSGLTEAADRRIGGFSGGMHQRLGIAQALLHQPSVLFLDEPTSSLDPAGRHEVLDLIASFRGQATVFLSSHILEDVDRICDTIGVIHQGKLLLVAKRDELLERYPVNAAVLEIDPLSARKIEALSGALLAQPWVEDLNGEGQTLRVMVSDIAAGKRAMLPLLAAQEVVVNRYEWVRPSLEEIFLEISA